MIAYGRLAHEQPFRNARIFQPFADQDYDLAFAAAEARDLPGLDTPGVSALSHSPEDLRRYCPIQPRLPAVHFDDRLNQNRWAFVLQHQTGGPEFHHG